MTKPAPQTGPALTQLATSLKHVYQHAVESSERIEALEQRIAALESDSRELTTRLVTSENHTGRLMSLYVATYQLHATLDPAEVQATIADIAINLLGAESFVLLLREGEGGHCNVAFSHNLPELPGRMFKDQVYLGGDEMIDGTLFDGQLRLGTSAGTGAIAVVPLTIQESVVGAVVLLRLFEHRAPLGPEDKDLLDLLAAHAASALFAARLYSTTDRKLRTLENLVQLVRGGAR